MTAKDASAYVAKFLKTLSDCGDFLDKKPELVIDSFERNLTHPKLRDIVRLRRGGGKDGFATAVEKVLKKAPVICRAGRRGRYDSRDGGRDSKDSRKDFRESKEVETCTYCKRKVDSTEKKKGRVKKHAAQERERKELIEVTLKKDPMVDLGVKSQCLIDSGASVSFISPDLVKKLNLTVSKEESSVEYGDRTKSISEKTNVYVTLRQGINKRLICFPVQCLVSSIVAKSKEVQIQCT
ncbi:hypothetical protein ADUPG1_013209 [Aduncisulcus paluster]|uniref:Gag-pol polyprotein n=1 Tax=Aduncisulcus paluster TaxID=2918883 RepID=A0ABQ5K255_9EUKA|nr:hypothetical protein ADUPG1_013209 [Aduncisulcus paluster]